MNLENNLSRNPRWLYIMTYIQYIVIVNILKSFSLNQQQKTNFFFSRTHNVLPERQTVLSITDFFFLEKIFYYVYELILDSYPIYKKRSIKPIKFLIFIENEFFTHLSCGVDTFVIGLFIFFYIQ